MCCVDDRTGPQLTPPSVVSMRPPSIERSNASVDDAATKSSWLPQGAPERTPVGPPTSQLDSLNHEAPSSVER